MHQEEQGKAHIQNGLTQQLLHYCFELDAGHFEEQWSESMDMELGETESAKTNSDSEQYTTFHRGKHTHAQTTL